MQSNPVSGGSTPLRERVLTQLKVQEQARCYCTNVVMLCAGRV
jgi:hypothetical protein